jgi:hypothetical protein
MIVADITSFIGQDSSAEHYYCNYNIVENFKESLYCNIGFHDEDLKRVITSEDEVSFLNEKDKCSSWFVGRETNRFESISQIKDTLLEQFKNQDIITYEDGKIFKDMLYIKNGIDVGCKEFGEVWLHVPSSIYKDLLGSVEQIKIKCGECGKVHLFEDVIEETTFSGREAIKFLKKRDVENPCCRYYELMWNQII